MAETLAGISGLTRKYLPSFSIDDVGKYLKIGEDGNPIFFAETPGGVVDEAGANAANDIGDASGATTALKLANLTSPATPSQQGVALLGASGGAAKLTKMPDGATAGEYLKTTFADTDSFSAVDSGGSSIAASGGKLVLAVTGGAGTYRILKTSAHTNYFGFVALEFDNNSAVTKVEMFNSTTSWVELTTKNVGASRTRYYGPYPMPIGYTAIQFRFTVSGNTSISISAIYYGTPSYLIGTLSEEAARIANQLGDSSGGGVAASGTITSNGTNVTAGDTVTIAGKVYTFRDATYWAGTPVEGDVLMGATSAASLSNLSRAIIREVASSWDGVYYKCAAQHPLVYTVDGASNTLPIYAGIAGGTNNRTFTPTTGEQGNSITLAKSAATLTLSGSTLTGGYSDAAKKIRDLAAPIIAGGGTRPAAAMIERTNTSLIGYEATVKVASGATYTFPNGGTFDWVALAYDANIDGADQGTAAGGSTVTMAGANSKLWIRRRS